MANHIGIQGNIAQQGATQINNSNFNTVYNFEDIDRISFRELRCPPDSDIVKNRLKENKGKMIPQLIEWVLRDWQYKSWKDGGDISLLWIKGGAGKGKTMMSIGLVEQLSYSENNSMVVTYFFCQHGNYELNTIQAIIKGLIRQLTNQRIELKRFLLDHWDHTNNCFDVDVTSWRTLWDIFLRMLNECKCQRVYIVVDALDECQDDGMDKFLRLIVRNGLDRPTKIKWLLTSRPLDSASRELLAGRDQVQVSLELNSEHVAQAVNIFITEKVEELTRRATFGKTLKQQVENELSQKSEGTFLWVSLVCEKLESVDRDEALATIQNLPRGLYNLYDRIFNELSECSQSVAKKCMRLLKVMILVYRPLKVEEVGSVLGLVDEEGTIKMLLDRCASVIKIQGGLIEFVHQSARDYLKGDNGQFILDSHEHYNHDEIAMNCLSYLSEQLKTNLLGLPRPDSTRETLEILKDEGKYDLLVSVDYAATFWVQHFKDTQKTQLVKSGFLTECAVSAFLHNKLLEWFECLSLLDRLPQAVGALRALTDAVKDNYAVFMLVQDSKRFLLRHYHTIANWPLQIYISAIIFSPESSIVRQNSMNKIPKWLIKIPCIERNWASLIQSLAGHNGPVGAVAFSPNGKQIASGSSDGTITIWDAATGGLQKTFRDHTHPIKMLFFSLNGKQIISESKYKDITLWDAVTGEFQRKLEGSPNNNVLELLDAASKDIPEIHISRHNHIITSSTGSDPIAFSSDGKHMAFGSLDGTIRLWDAATGDFWKTLAANSSQTKIKTVTFSPDGKQIVSGSLDGTVKLWDPNAPTDDFQKPPANHSIWGNNSVTFSPNGKWIASSSLDGTIKLWDSATGNFWKTLTAHSSQTKINLVKFSPDGKHIASSSLNGNVKIWDAVTGNLQKTLTDSLIKTSNRELKRAPETEPSLARINAVAFSPDGKHIASGSWDKTIKLWNAVTGDLQMTLIGHLDWVNTVAFSPSGKHIISGSEDNTVRVWNIGKANSSHVNSLYASRRIKTPGPVHTIKLASYKYYIATNVGPIFPNGTSAEGKLANLVSLQDLYVGDQWIYYGLLPLIRLPSDFQAKTHDAHGNRIAFLFENNRFFSFDIDRHILQSKMRCHAT